MCNGYDYEALILERDEGGWQPYYPMFVAYEGDEEDDWYERDDLTVEELLERYEDLRE